MLSLSFFSGATLLNISLPDIGRFDLHPGEGQGRGLVDCLPHIQALPPLYRSLF